MNPGLPAPGDLEPIPGQLALPGMPPADGGTGGFRGQLALPGLELPAPDAPGAGAGAGDDSELAAVATELHGLDGDGSLMAAAIRGALDMLLDGQHTGRAGVVGSGAGYEDARPLSTARSPAATMTSPNTPAAYCPAP